MKFFSKKRWTALFVSGILSLVCIGTGVNALTKETAKAETYTRPVAENIEDLIDSRSDFYRPREGFGLIKDTDNWNSASGVTKTSNGQTQTHYYYDTKTSDATNTLDYDGNLAFYATTDGASAKTLGTGIKLNGVQTAYGKTLNTEADPTAGNGYGLISFRTVFDSTQGLLSLGIMEDSTDDYALAHKYGHGNYGIVLGVYANKMQICYVSGSTKGTTDKSHTGTTIADETEIIVTFGVYKSAADKNNCYLKIVDANNGTVYTEQDWTTGVLNPPTDSAVRNFSIESGFCQAASSATPVSFCIAGVEEPIYSPLSFEEETPVAVGTALKDVTLSKSEYSFGDSTDTIAIGTNEYQANLNYYGKTVENAATVTITGVYEKTTSVNVPFVSGQTLGSIELPAGFAFAESDMNKLVPAGVTDYGYVGTYTDGTNTQNAYIQLTCAAPTAVNVETIVKDYADIDVGLSGHNYLGEWYSAENATGTYGSTAKPIDYKISTAKATEAATDNFNNYAGNLSVYFGDYYSGIGWNPGARVYFENTGHYGAISFAMKFSYDSTYSFGLQQTKSSLKSTEASQGYRIQLQKASMLGIRKVVGTAEQWMPYTYILDGTATEVESAKYCEMAALEDTVWTVSYGIYPTIYNGQEANAIWIKFLTGQGKTLEAIAYDVEPSTVNHGATGLTENHKFAIGICDVDSSTKTVQSKLTLEGISAPLFMNDYVASYATTATTEGEEGEKLSTVGLPAGYAWKDGETVLNSDVKSYKATTATSYYGNAISVDADVAVTVNNTRTTLVFMDGAKQLFTTALRKGETFNFSDVAFSGTTLIGWENAGSLYQANYAFTATAEVGNTITYNAIKLDFKMIAGAAVRLSADENGYGGLRFIVAFNSTEWANVQSYITGAYGVIVPVDDTTYFDHGFTAAAKALYRNAENSFVGKVPYDYETLNLKAGEAEGYDLYTFALTNIKYENYNRAFAGMAFITVTYADGTTADIETAYNAADNTRSVYQVATAAYAHHTSVEGGVYSNKQLEMIEQYKVNVLDLDYEAETNTLELVDRTQDDLDRPYTLKSATVGETITIVLENVAADSLLATSDFVPANVSGIPGTDGIVRFVGSIVYDPETQTATITASMSTGRKLT